MKMHAFDISHLERSLEILRILKNLVFKITMYGTSILSKKTIK